MSNILNYKGYMAKIDFDADSKVLCGKIEGITDLVTFESSSADDIVKEFYNAVDDYLSFCKNIGKEPEKSYKGIFNVRIPPDLHRKAAMSAIKKGVTLNGLITDAIQSYLTPVVTPYIINTNIYESTKRNFFNDDSIFSSSDSLVFGNRTKILN